MVHRVLLRASSLRPASLACQGSPACARNIQEGGRTVGIRRANRDRDKSQRWRGWGHRRVPSHRMQARRGRGGEALARLATPSRQTRHALSQRRGGCGRSTCGSRRAPHDGTGATLRHERAGLPRGRGDRRGPCDCCRATGPHRRHRAAADSDPGGGGRGRRAGETAQLRRACPARGVPLASSATSWHAYAWGNARHAHCPW